MGEWGPHSHKHKLNMADFILNMPLRFFARVFGNPAGDPVLLKSRGETLLRDSTQLDSFYISKTAGLKHIYTHIYIVY